MKQLLKSDFRLREIPLGDNTVWVARPPTNGQRITPTEQTALLPYRHALERRNAFKLPEIVKILQSTTQDSSQNHCLQSPRLTQAKPTLLRTRGDPGSGSVFSGNESNDLPASCSERSAQNSFPAPRQAVLPRPEVRTRIHCRDCRNAYRFERSNCHLRDCSPGSPAYCEPRYRS